MPSHRGAKVRGGSPRRRDANPPRRSIRRSRHRDLLAPRRRPLRRQDHELRPGRDAAHGDVRRGRRARVPLPMDGRCQGVGRADAGGRAGAGRPARPRHATRHGATHPRRLRPRQRGWIDPRDGYQRRR